MAQQRHFNSEQITDSAALISTGESLRELRLRLNKTQSELADEAGVSLSTVKRIEAGSSVQLDNFFALLRALGIADRIHGLIPTELPNPILQQKLGRAKRLRASKKSSADNNDAKWQWGDES
ncbi:MAG: helix-turn-helix transcriptional regulator [Planctomycetes bacterium]|nr:helix-turn-helix transcriptional regulator [Planctomycetota bacterium]